MYCTGYWLTNPVLHRTSQCNYRLINVFSYFDRQMSFFEEKSKMRDLFGTIFMMYRFCWAFFPHNYSTVLNEPDMILKNSVVAEVQLCDYIF